VSQPLRAYHLPGFVPRVAGEVRRFADVEVEIARLDPRQLQETMTAAKECARRRLRRRAVDDVLASIDRIVVNWLDPNYELRQVAERALPAVTGFSAAMIGHGLPLLIEPLRAVAIGTLLDDELGNRGVLDTWRDGRRALGPALVAHVMSGNIPALAVTSMLLSLAVKSAALVKSATGDLVFPALFAASVDAVDEELGHCLVATHWPGGDRAIEEVAFAGADVVVGSGSDTAIAAIGARVPGRFIGHGHKISFAAIGAESLADADAAQHLARRLAYDVSLWDQQGCLSPQLCYVESGGRVSPTDFAHMLANGLRHYAGELPPRALNFEERAAVSRFRQEAEWRGTSTPALLATTDTTDWTVSIEDNAEFVPSCLHRCIRVKVIDTLSDVGAAVLPHSRYLEAAGVAVGEQRFEQIAEMLAACGVHRICPIGAMQRPPLSWQQSGRPRVADWIQWTAQDE